MTKPLRLFFLIFLLTACTFPSVAPTPVAPAVTVSPSPVPPTSTVTPPAPTATFVPSTRYFQNDFNTTDLTDWTTILTAGEAGLFDVRVEKGFLIFDLGGKSLSGFALYQPEIYKNLRLDVHLVSQNETPYVLNLVCRYSEQYGWYQYEVFNSGAYNLYYFVWNKEKQAIPTLLVEGVADSMARGNSVNEIGMSCNDRDLKLYVNGELIRTYPENQYVLRDGRVGVGVSSFDSIPVLVSLDWLKITIP